MGLMELSPGREVIRRLLRLELIEEFPDPDDGRAKRVQLTAKGREMYQQVETEIDKVGKIISGNLTLEEKHHMVAMLGKLVHFHYPIWYADADSGLDVIVEKYVGVN